MFLQNGQKVCSVGFVNRQLLYGFAIRLDYFC